MKQFFLFFSLIAVGVSGDEIERIERVLSDITELRKSYDKSQDELSACRVDLSDEKQKNEIILKKLKSLENEVENLNNQIGILQKENKSKKIKKVIIKEKIEKCIDNQITEKNEFPTLKLRDEFLDEGAIDTTAHTYRLQKESQIFDAPEGKAIDLWEAKTSFTSNYRDGKWIKVTGYFIERVWHKAAKELWVRAEDTKQR